MSVNQFDPKQITTLETPVKIIEEQHQATVTANNNSNKDSVRAVSIGFISLG